MRITLRFGLRILGAITITLLIFIAFIHSNNAYKALLKEHLSKALNYQKYGSSSSLPVINSTTPISSVQELWHFWATIYTKTKPTVPKLELMHPANNIPVPHDDFTPRDQTAELLQAWDSISKLKDLHYSFLNHLHAWSEPSTNTVFSGKGVVTVGGGEYFGPAINSIQMLRRTGSDLPVEVFLADKSEYEPAICELYLPKLGAECKIIADSVNGFEVTHYQLKSLAMLLSSFEEVLYLDSDSMPLLNPETELFATEPYISTGLVIWPDFWVATESPSFYTVVGLEKMPEGLPRSSSEAGQLLIDKRRHLKTLLLSNYYNIYGPKYYYPLLSQGALGQGDKETFMAAAMVLGNSHYRVKTGVESVNRHDGFQEKGSGMIQFNPADDLQKHNNKNSGIRVRPAFIHANTPKMNAGHLADEGDLINSVDNSALRLWGSKEEQIKTFGLDLEKTVWELLVPTGCELADVIRDWSSRKDLCEHLKQHWNAVFGID